MHQDIPPMLLSSDFHQKDNWLYHLSPHPFNRVVGISLLFIPARCALEQIWKNFHNGECPYIIGPGLAYVVVDVVVDTAIFVIPMPLVN